ncbi:MAG TPA: hypothetical protein VMW08_19860, partial [Acidimicrobiales bacterium]|nr:hypothetical protein [Acidimicrobiales bacterium]
VMLFAVGCGDDDDSSDSSASDYCNLSAELDASDTEPTPEDFEAIVAAAPDEIKDDIEVFVAAGQSGDLSAPGVAEAEANLLAFEEANCTE